MKSIQAYIKKIVDFAGNIYLFLACVMLVICVGSTAVGVFFRYVLSTPLDWVEEAAALTQAWMVCLMIPRMDIRYNHITMEIVFDAAGRKFQLAVRVLQSVLTCAMAIYLLRYAIKVVQMNAKLGTITGTLLIPFSWVYAALPITFVLMVIVHVGKLITADYQLPVDKSDETEVSA